MKPYYEDDFVTIYLRDARTWRVRGPADVIVTDPPYGIGWRRGVNHARGSKAHVGIANDHDTSVRDEVLTNLPELPAIVFGSFYAPFPANVRQVLVWHKPADAGLVGATTGYRRDAEPIFLVGPWPIRTVERSSVLHVSAGQAGTVTATGHPHTKPVSLMVRLIESTPPGTILDPFIGLEIDERYCEIAALRCSQEVLGLSA